ncbi:unnamed protein product [Rotaria sp. Silwood1]|nr:unnamed protein product [Rotaria sp. Silwood1]CAF3500202.1 unnamed protein product [Rotaria sp. Silwood1]CAF3506060.1 unnamed protein product [Rotaria sp. Silwood1]CAF3536610.1 unnamed protein product [Rotaria sp. Silwood1]CAF4585153.1 unnamed protein product [Rotaria sp. Silwood1]
MKSSLRLKHTCSNVQKRIDDSNEFYPLLDYSFHDAEKIEDAVLTQPRVASGAPNVIKEGNQYHSYGINLNHNKLNGSLETLPNFIRKIFINPNALSIIDLSFNTFTEIPIAITQFSLLKHFYFHKNFLININEIQKLYSLKELKYLTLHRNPIEDNIPYLRSYVLCLLPGLRSFNCTPISKSDLKTSNAWQKMNKNLTPKILNKILQK